MVHGFERKGIPVLKPNRSLKVKNSVYRIFLGSLCAFAVLLSTPAGALEKTKASALVLKEIQAPNSLSFKKSPQSTQADPCLPLLHARHLSPGGSAVSQNWRPARKTAVPVALGFFLGVRIALGPKEVQKPSGRVQIGPEIRTAQHGDNYALAIAAYRSCKNNHVLSLERNKNDIR
jgi:hypothetical protein